MRSNMVGLFLSLAVLFISIELSSQSDSMPQSHNSRGNPPPRKFSLGESSAQFTRSRRMTLPDPYYYDTNGVIRSHVLPGAHAVVDNIKGYFFGMAKGEHFFPIIQHGKYKIFNLKDHIIISLRQEEFEVILDKANFETIIDLPTSYPSRESPGPSTNLQLRPPGQK